MPGATTYVNPKATARGGYREDLGIAVRSQAEANFARLMTRIRVPWSLEPITFKFEGIEHGERFYTPDFLIEVPDRSKRPMQWPEPLGGLDAGEWFVELKGWMDPKSQTKLTRFCERYSKDAERLVLLCDLRRGERERWTPKLNQRLRESGVRVGSLSVFLQWGALLGIPHWEGGGR
jgi:hypothetical protein